MHYSITQININAEEGPWRLFFNMYVFCVINIDNLFILKVICWHLYRVSSGSRTMFLFPDRDQHNDLYFLMSSNVEHLSCACWQSVWKTAFWEAPPESHQTEQLRTICKGYLFFSLLYQYQECRLLISRLQLRWGMGNGIKVRCHKAHCSYWDSVIFLE